MRALVAGAAVLVLAGSLIAGRAGAGGLSRSADTFTVAGGTWINGPAGALYGPAWELDGPSPSFVATVSLTTGAFSQAIGGATQRFPGMPATRSIDWSSGTCTSCGGGAVTAWSAIGSEGFSQVSFSINFASRLKPIAIDRNSIQSSASKVSARWAAGADAKSFLVYLEPQSGTPAPRVGVTILPGTARGVTLAHLNLDTKQRYTLAVFAFSMDIAGASPPSVFNVASDVVTVKPGVSTIPVCAPAMKATKTHKATKKQVSTPQHPCRG